MKQDIKLYLFIFLFFIAFGKNVFAQQEISIDAIMDKAMTAAETYSQEVGEYEAELYMRIYVQTLKKNFLYQYTHLIPKFVLHDRNSNEGLIEVLSDLKFNYPNNYTADIKYLAGTFSQKHVDEMLPTSLVHLNVYNETSSNERFFMPLRKSSQKYYRYSLSREYEEDGHTFYTISFKPIYRSPQLLEGKFVLEKETWRVVQFVCEGVDLASEFSIELYMGSEEQNKLLPVDAIIHQKFTYLGNEVSNRNLVQINYHSITLHEKRPKSETLNLSNLYRVRMDSVPLNNDPSFWEKARKIPLQAKEEELLNEFYINQLNNREKNDSLKNSKNNSAAWTKTMVSNTTYKYKDTDIKYSGIFNPFLFAYSSLDGLTYRQKLNVNYELPRQSSIELDAFVGYMFNKKELFTSATAAWNYNPTHMGKLSFSIGNDNKTYSSIFLKEVQDSLLNNGMKLNDLALDYYKDYYMRLYNSVEIANGLTVGTGIDYHIRDATDNKIDEQAVVASATLSKKEQSNGITKMFKRQKTFAPVATLTWTPRQYYRYEGRQKIYERSLYPTIKLEFSKALNGIMGSETEYNRMEFDISQNIQFDLMKSFQYHIGMGFFSNQRSEYFTDFEYFAKRNFPETWDDGIGGVFNLLDRQFYNASDTYIQNHFMYESPFLVLNLVPALSQGVITERIYFSHLYNPYIRSYAELGYGIGNNFLNAALFGSFHKLKFHEIGFKVSLNVFKK